MTTMPWLRAARFWIKRRGSGSGSVKSVWNVVTIGLRQSRTKSNTRHAPLAGVEAELVLQAHHVARAVVGHLRGQAVGVRAAVVDDVDHARIVVAERRASSGSPPTRTPAPAARSTASAEIPGERRQSALFRRIGRYEKGRMGAT